MRLCLLLFACVTGDPHSVKLAQLGREIESRVHRPGYRESAPPGARHLDYSTALRTRCTIRTAKIRSLFQRVCPRMSAPQATSLLELLRRTRPKCEQSRSAEQLEAVLRSAVTQHAASYNNATCARTAVYQNDQAARGSVASLKRLQSLSSAVYPNKQPATPAARLPARARRLQTRRT